MLSDTKDKLSHSALEGDVYVLPNLKVLVMTTKIGQEIKINDVATVVETIWVKKYKISGL